MKQRRTRAAQQRELSARCATKENLRPIEPARQPNTTLAESFEVRHGYVSDNVDIALTAAER
jgi:hypothetical protein